MVGDGRIEPCLAHEVPVASLQLGDLALSPQTAHTTHFHFQPDITVTKATLIRVVKGEVVGTWFPDVNPKTSVILQPLPLFTSLAFTCAA